ncbi:MAG: MFS transporter [Actinomycetes bacterium]
MTKTLRERAQGILPRQRELRIMSASSLINTFGNGLFYTIEIIFLTRSVGLSPHQVGLGFTIGALIGLPMSIPAGYFAHRVNIRYWVTISSIIEGIVAGSFIFIHSFIVFLALTIFVNVMVTVTQTFRMIYVNEIGGEGEARVRFRAYQRAVTNLGIGLGTACAGIALVIDSRTAYATLVVIDGVTFVIAGLIYLKLPNVVIAKSEPNSLEQKASRLVALRDTKYLSAMVLNAIYSTHFVIQTVGLPLWIINYTKAPRWIVSAVLLVNTFACVLFSVRASKGTGENRAAARIFFRAGLYVAGGCGLYAFAQGTSPIVASALLLLGMGLHVTGELLGSAAGWAFGFGLAKPGYEAQYQGVWQLSWGLGGIFGPVLITTLLVDLHKLGWIILAAIFIASTYLFIPLVNSMKDRA